MCSFSYYVDMELGTITAGSPVDRTLCRGEP